MGYKHLENEKLEEYAKGKVPLYLAEGLVIALSMELLRARKEIEAYRKGAVRRCDIKGGQDE